jgi:hypothetical protein
MVVKYPPLKLFIKDSLFLGSWSRLCFLDFW